MNKLSKTILKMKKKSVPLDVNCTFRQLTTLGCGGTIYLTIYPETIRQLIFAARYLRGRKIPHFFLGYGSNVLASDEPFDGVVAVTSRVKNIVVDDVFVTADCGASTSRLCSVLVQNGLSGGEFFGCLPATVGGAVVCNAGCFGKCAQDVVQSVTVLHNGKIKTLSNSECCFSKRRSIFKNNSDYVVLSAKMKFAKGDPLQIQNLLKQMREKKAATQPLGERSAGCVLFGKESVSQLLDKAGLKGYSIGGAKVSEKHAGFVINVDKAASKEVYLLIEHMKKVLAEKFGVDAETELCLINFPQSRQS